MATRFVLALAALTLAGCTGRLVTSGPVHHETQSIELDKAERARVEIRMGVGQLNVGGDSPRLLDAEFAYDNPALKPIVRYQPGSFRGQLSIEEPGVHSAGPASRYDWNLR